MGSGENKWGVVRGNWWVRGTGELCEEERGAKRRVEWGEEVGRGERMWRVV